MESTKEQLEDSLHGVFGFFGSARITDYIMNTKPKNPGGRPRLKETKVRPFSFTLHEETVEKLTKSALDKGITKSALLREIIENSL